MNKIVKYVCIFIILVGLYFLFSSSATYEGYLDKAQEYANLVNTGMAGTNKITKNYVLNNNSPYGSNGIATKGYDGNGNAIFDFDKNGVPVIGYQGNTPILGIPTAITGNPLNVVKIFNF